MTTRTFNPNTNEHLEHVLKKAYKFTHGDMGIGTEEMSGDLCDAICNLIGPNAFSEWCDRGNNE